jgi:hypothetical protein
MKVSEQRKVIQRNVVMSTRHQIARLVRELVPARERRAEACQVGALGVLVALETFDPTGDLSFDELAAVCAVREIQLWQAATA